MKISEIITDKYKLRMPPKMYYDLLADVVEAEEEQEPCDDVVSRQAVLDLAKRGILVSNGNYKSVCKAINDLPSAGSRELKTGHWIRQDNTKEPLYGWYFCSECKSVIGDKTKFCSNCGAKMVEPQESEDKE